MAAGLLETLLQDGRVGTGREPAWLDAARRLAAQDLSRDGLPATRNEAWKYTSLRALEQRRYARGDAAAGAQPVESTLLDLPGISGPRIVFVNGVFRADLSRLDALPGLTLAPLSLALGDDAEPLRFFLARHFDDAAQAFARLNTALAVDGPVIRVAAGAHIAESVHVVFVATAATSDIAWHARALVELGEGATLDLVEHHLAATPNAHLGNVVAQYALRPRAQLNLVQIQNAAETAVLIRRSDALLEADSQLDQHAVEAGAQLMRHDLVVALAGDRARFNSSGVFALRGRQHADTHLDVRHIARDTVSNVLWRGVADQRARGVFHGAITVAPGADGSDASLSNKNLLLSAQAEIDTQPALEIHADEVKASHGATVGQLDENALFYLRTRGLPAGQARSLLTLAFCREAIDALPNPPLREHLDALLLERLPQELARSA